MSENLKFCKGCHQIKEKIEFFGKSNEMKATCKDCREWNGASKWQKREQNIQNITEDLTKALIAIIFF